MRSSHDATASLIFKSCPPLSHLPTLSQLSAFVHVWLFALAFLLRLGLACGFVFILTASTEGRVKCDISGVWCGACKKKKCFCGACTESSKQVEHHLFVAARSRQDLHVMMTFVPVCLWGYSRVRWRWWPTFSLLLSLFARDRERRRGAGSCFGNGIRRLKRDDSGMW